MEPILECRQLYKSYPGQPALNGVDLVLYPGQIVGLLGPNGSGKTTLLKLAAGLLRPTAGGLLVSGQAPGSATKGLVSYLPDRISLPGWMSPQQLTGLYAGFFPDFDAAAAGEMLARLGVRTDTPVRTLSKGNREKVQLIMTMCRRTALYLLDEPIGGVDPAARDYILDLILQQYNPGSTVIISTHLIADVERVLSQVVFLYGGQVQLHEDAQQLRQERGCSVDAFFREVYRC